MKTLLAIPGRAARLLLLCLSLSLPCSAEPGPDFDRVAADLFWHQLYPAGGYTLYCGYKFAGNRKTASGLSIDIEHIYPVSRMATYSGCENRMQCRESGHAVFMQMEADLHNLYPAWQSLITYKYDLDFGLVAGEDWRFDDCDIEWREGVMEPRTIARGNIARSMLYMHATYNIPIDPATLALYRAWNSIDPPSRQDQARNDIIERLQGRRNPYIDRPELADQRKLTMSNTPR